MQKLTQEDCLELKKAGFPQNPIVVEDGLPGLCKSVQEGNFYTSSEFGNVYEPTLSELIEACGNRFAMLGINRPGNWYSRADETCDECASDEPLSYGHNPEQAVKNLYLTLNKKQS